jgi:hypothetical protein
MNDGRVSHNFFETRPPNAGLRSTHGLTVKQSQRKLSREAKNKKKKQRLIQRSCTFQFRTDSIREIISFHPL